MNRLERLGWEVAAEQLLAIRRSEAGMLALLVLDRPGGIVRYETLAEATGRGGASTPASERAVVRMGCVRRALIDIGFPAEAVQTVTGIGYQVPMAWAAAIARAVADGRVEAAA